MELLVDLCVYQLVLLLTTEFLDIIIIIIIIIIIMKNEDEIKQHISPMRELRKSSRRETEMHHSPRS